MKILKKNKTILVIAVAVAFFVTACVNVQQQTVTPVSSYKYNFASLYNPAASDMHPEIRIFLKSESEATIFYNIPLIEIKASANDQMASETKLMLKYVIRNSADFSVADSGSLVNVINLRDNQELIKSHFNVKIPLKSDSKIVVSIYGQKENSGKRILASINTEITSAQRYLPEVFEGNETNVVFGNYINSEKIYRFTSSTSSLSNLKFDYYKFTDYVNIPPYYLTTYHSQARNPDSTYNYTAGDSVRFTADGVYVLRSPSQTTGGLCVINAGNEYPEIKTVANMLEPLKLLATNKEFNEIKNAENLKLAIDNYWLSKSNNQKFAKEQIRVFYNRVYLANIYFTEDKEGWKTDRGMLYVMFGPPSIVNINATGEEWFYGENPDVAGILFIFDKVNNPLCGTAMALRRDSNYQSVWAQALQTWKNGRIFTITN